MKLAKRLLAVLIVLAMIISMAMTAFAEETPEGASEAVEGEAIEGESAEGESAEGESAEGESAEGESAEGESAEGESAEGESGEGEVETLPAPEPTITAIVPAQPETTTEETVNTDEHSLHLLSVPNARQLGGYTTEDGRKVRENVLLRTGWLTEASEEDLKTLSEVYHVTTIVDFRSAMELTRTPDMEVAGAEYVNISMEDKEKEANAAASLAEMAAVNSQYANQPGRAMIEMIRLGWRAPLPDMYITMITSTETEAAYRAFFDLLLAQDENSVVLYHCKGGKDRTGIATMYILTLLGVDKETILEDFELTNQYLADEINSETELSRPYAETEEELNDVAINTGVSREFLENAYDYVEEQYGSMLEFIKQKYNVTDEEIETLRNLYLTD